MAITDHHDREKLQEVTMTHSDVEANIIKSLLEAAGITCVLVTQVPHSVYPISVNGLGEIKIKVLDSDLEAARQVLRDQENAGLDEKGIEE
jgi:hypothetical protein